MVKSVKLSSLVEDRSLYPRSSVDDSHIGDLVRALESGAMFPPIVVQSGTMKIVDGVHRVRAYLKVLGEDGSARVDLREYENEAALFVAAVEANSHHGRKLTRQDQSLIVLKLREYGIEDKTISIALHVPEPVVQQLSVRIVFAPDGEAVPAKRGTAYLHGKPMTQEQIDAMRSVRSAEVGRLCEELYKLIKTDLVDRENEKILAKLKVLGTAIDEYLVAIAA